MNRSVVAWLLVTTNYTVRNQARQERRYQRFLSRLPPPVSTPDFSDDVAEAEQREIESRALHDAFAELKPHERDILTLCVIEDMSVRNAAAVLGIAEGTVKSRLHRAKSKLRDVYDTSTTPDMSSGRNPSRTPSRIEQPVPGGNMP